MDPWWWARKANPAPALESAPAGSKGIPEGADGDHRLTATGPRNLWLKRRDSLSWD